MITTIRKGIHTQWFKVFLWFILSVFIFVSLGLPELMRRNSQSGEWIFKINGVKVFEGEYKDRVAEEQQNINYLQRQLGPLIKELGLDLNPLKLAEENLQQERLVDAIADQLNIEIDPELVLNTLLRQLPPGKSLEEMCSIMGQTVEGLQSKISENMRRSAVMDIVSGMAYVPEGLIKRAYVAQYAKRAFGVVTFPFEHFIAEAKKTVISDADARAHFEKENKEFKRYWIPEQRTGLQWIFEPTSFDVKVSDEAIANYYNKHKREEFMSAPAQIKLNRVLFVIPEKSDAAAIEQLEKEVRAIRAELVEKPDSVALHNNNTVLDFFPRGTHDKEFEKAVFALEKNGDISEVIKTKEGFVIAQRMDKKAAEYKPLTEVTNDIKKRLIDQRFAAAFMAQAQRAIRSDKEDKASSNKAINSFIADQHGKQEKIAAVSFEQAKSPVLKKLFDLKEGKYAAVQESLTKGVLVKLEGVVAGHYPSFEEVRSQVIDDMYAERARALRDVLLVKVHALSSAESLEKIAKDFNGIYVKTPLVNAQSTTELDELRSKHIPVDMMLSLAQVGERIQYVNQENNDSFVIRLDEVEAFTQADVDAQRKTLKEGIQRDRQQSIEQGFVASLHRNAIIEKNDKIEQSRQRNSI
jgi:peptidyl-prolyl cis-trans isomerase D